jgi:hypothetical protein
MINGVRKLRTPIKDVVRAGAKMIDEMPFGKHAGMPLADIPLGYLEWACRNIKFGELQDAIRRVYRERTGNEPPAVGTKPMKRRRGETVARNGRLNIFYHGDAETSNFRRIEGNAYDEFPAWPGVEHGHENDICPFEVEGA